MHPAWEGAVVTTLDLRIQGQVECQHGLEKYPKWPIHDAADAVLGRCCFAEPKGCRIGSAGRAFFLTLPATLEWASIYQ